MAGYENYVVKVIMRAILVVLFVSCKPEKPDMVDKLKIATLNCAFLWDGIEPEEGNPAVDFPHKGDPVLAREHMAKIAGVIRTVNADIINLVEVEGIEALRFLNDTFLHDLNYHIGFVKGTDTYTGQDVAVLSRYRADTIFRYKEKGKSGDVEKSVSKNYVALFKIGQTNIAVIGLHFLARPLDWSRLHERQAQADAIRQVAVQKYKKGYGIIVLGDFNDYDGGPCCVDVNNNLPITSVLADIKAMDSVDIHDDLINAVRSVPQQKRFTAHWDRDGQGDVDKEELSAIDHILLSRELYANIDSVYIYQGYNPFEISDHFPVVVEIVWR